MEFLEKVWEQMALYVSVPYLLIFMLLAYFIKKYFEAGLTKLFGIKFHMVYVVLILATLLAVPFFIWSDEGVVKILATYAIGTSLHELIFQWIEKKFTS